MSLISHQMVNVIIIAFAISLPRLSFGQSSASEPLKELLAQLDAEDYRQREKATKSLIDLGPAAIESLFRGIGSVSPEAAFRRVKIIKQIGTSGDIGVLKSVVVNAAALTGFPRDLFAGWSGRAISQWRTRQTEIAVGHLKKDGISVVSFDELSNVELFLMNDLQERVAEVKRPVHDFAAVLRQINEIENPPTNSSTDPDASEKSPETGVAEQRRLFATKNGNVLTVNGLSESVGPAKQITIDENWNGDVEGLKWLASISNVGMLELIELDVDDQILNKLKGVSGLNSLRLTRCTFSFEQVRRFRNQWPGKNPLDLMAVGAGYLGVYGPTSPNGSIVVEDGSGSVVSLVSNGSAAEEAGLRQGDVIFKVDSDPVQSFPELAMAISSKPVGKKVMLHVRRGEEKIELTARLKSREGIR